MNDKSTVLVVDDDRQITEALRLRLELAGYAVVTRSDGAAALSAVHSHRIDALITDIAMPTMDGEMLLRCLNETGAVATMPVIVLTTNLSADQRQRFTELGARHCVAKPYDSDNLLALLRSIIRAPAAHRATV